MRKDLPYMAVPLHASEDARKALADAGLREAAQAVKIAVEDPARPVDGTFERLAIPVTDIQAGFDLLRRKGIEALPGVMPFEVREPQERIAYDLFGEIAVLREGGATEAGDIVERHPRVRTVYLTRGIEGDLRTPDLVLLAGPDNPRSVVRESGFDIEVDVRNAYFSPRLAHERERVASMAAAGEVVLDMFCGVGPFSLHLARKGCTVRAVDLNPAAVALARTNAQRNGLADRIDVMEGDAAEVVPSMARDGLRADRVVMNHPTAAMDFLAAAAEVVDAGTIHLYILVVRDGLDAAIARARGPLSSRVVDLAPHLVRSVSPAEDQWCLDIALARRTR
ncbi:MAG: methyltransferase domain-containing protein [Thermoplasmata archaeon]|nr:methyltransferase domain-containing protein [Thermoplasmata archaeon]